MHSAPHGARHCIPHSDFRGLHKRLDVGWYSLPFLYKVTGLLGSNDTGSYLSIDRRQYAAACLAVQ